MNNNIQNNIIAKAEEININGIMLQIREYQNQRVVTFKDIDNLHKRPEGIAKKWFNDNKKHFIKGEDFFRVKCGGMSSFSGRTVQNGSESDIILITESGYLMLVKSFTDDLSWDVQKKLINTYFREKDNIVNTVKNITTPLTREELVAYMIYNSQIIEEIKESNERFINIIKENNESLLTQQLNSINHMIDFIKELCEHEKEQTEKCGTIMYSALYSLNKAIESNKNYCYSPSTTLLQQNIHKEEDAWKENAFKISEQICTNLKIKGKNVALLKIYASIENNDDIDLNIEKENYMKKKNIKKLSTISFISTSKKLQDLFDKRAKELLESTYCNNRENNINNYRKQDISFSKLAVRIPISIWEIVTPLYKIGYKKTSVMRFVYQEMEKISGVSLTNIANAYAKQHHVKNVSRGFVISEDEKLMKILKHAVNRLMNNTKKV